MPNIPDDVSGNQRLTPTNPSSVQNVHVSEVQRLIQTNPISEPHVHVPEVQRLIPSNPISEPHVHVPEVQRLIPSNPISEPHVHVPEVQRLTKNPLSFNPVKTAENAAGHQSLQFSEATLSLNIDANNALKSFFQGSHIYCGTFNISVNFQLLPAAKRPRMENGS